MCAATQTFLIAVHKQNTKKKTECSRQETEDIRCLAGTSFDWAQHGPVVPVQERRNTRPVPSTIFRAGPEFFLSFPTIPTIISFVLLRLADAGTATARIYPRDISRIRRGMQTRPVLCEVEGYASQNMQYETCANRIRMIRSLRTSGSKRTPHI